MESSSDRNLEGIRARVAEIGAALGARAAGYWQFDPANQQLVQISFVPGVGLDPEVGRQFAAATATAPLSQTSLGIVAAVLTGQPAISHAADLPADSGSGRWLRAFGASRSVAVPIRDPAGSVLGVISVALAAENQAPDEAISETLLTLARRVP